jgi:hypothetical protein
VSKAVEENAFKKKFQGEKSNFTPKDASMTNMQNQPEINPNN